MLSGTPTVTPVLALLNASPTACSKDMPAPPVPTTVISSAVAASKPLSIMNATAHTTNFFTFCSSFSNSIYPRISVRIHDNLYCKKLDVKNKSGTNRRYATQNNCSVKRMGCKNFTTFQTLSNLSQKLLSRIKTATIRSRQR